MTWPAGANVVLPSTAALDRSRRGAGVCAETTLLNAAAGPNSPPLLQAASDVIAPLDGEVVEINNELADDASLVRTAVLPGAGRACSAAWLRRCCCALVSHAQSAANTLRHALQHCCAALLSICWPAATAGQH